jgi:hypothetical protein
MKELIDQIYLKEIEENDDPDHLDENEDSIISQPKQSKKEYHQSFKMMQIVTHVSNLVCYSSNQP